jgi:ABC-type glycerol-3-phosphate transport system substrate-binding protein
VSGALASPDRPDVVIGLPEHALAWDAQNGVVDLSPYLADPKWGLSAEEIADFPPVFWKQDEVGGRRLGMPAQRTTRLLFYNKTWARELGFTAPPASPEEFEKQACAANAAMRANGDTSDDGFGGWYLDADPLTVLSWMLAFGGGAQEGEGYRFLTPENIEAFRFVKTLFERGCAFGPVDASAAESFAARRALFVSGGLENMSALTRALHTRASTDEWAILPFPGGSRNTVIVHGSSFIMLPSTEKEQLAAWLFIRWMVSPERQAEWVQATGLFPLRNSTLTRVADYASTHPQWVDAVKLLPRGRGTPQLASWRQVRAALGDGFAFMFRVDEQAPAILADLDRVVQDLVK